MARSLKKMDHLLMKAYLKNVDAMNASGDKSVIKTWSRRSNNLPFIRWTHNRCS